MPKATVYEWDAVANNNTDVGGVDIQGGSLVNNFDNALRTIMSQVKTGVDYKQVYGVKSGNYTALAIDNNAFHNFTGATPTLSLTAAATLGANWHYDGYSTGGPVIIDPNASELINGATTITVPQNCLFSIKCDGTGFLCTITTGSGIANASLAQATQGTIKGRPAGIGTGFVSDMSASDVFTILGSLVPAKPISGAGVGQWVAINPGMSNGYQFPAGGTWCGFWVGFNPSGALASNAETAIAAGGTLVRVATANVGYQGFAWRIA